MKSNVALGSLAAAALLGAGVLAGSVIGNSSVSAQTPSATATATAVAPGSGSTAVPTDPADPRSRMGRGGLGGGRGHHDGFGGRGFGAGATAEGATRSLAAATEIIDTVNGDLTYATGKMDTADVADWLNGAASLLASAETANSNSQYGQASAYAQAAAELAVAARSAMAQELGVETLPSYGTLRGGRGKDGTATGPTITQAQSSRVLAQVYNHLVSTEAVIANASNASQAQTYLTDAQAAYRTAYDAYQAGNYSDAAGSARTAERLVHVARSVAFATDAPANADTPVTVPAPNF